MSEKCIPLNLDLTCLRVNSSLEDSLTIASSILSLVKSVEPTIITIQCLVTEESLDYLLFKKLPGNTYDKKYIKSPDVERSANTCIAWNTHIYRATPVDLLGVAKLFPQTNLGSTCMVHLWPKNSGNLSLTVCSWTGLNYCVDNRERNLYFETFLKFILAFRTLNNYKLRILIGGLFNVDLKVVQFWKFPDVVPLVYSNRPNPNERRELKCSFIYTKDNLKVLEHNVNKIGEKGTDHWAINAQLTAFSCEKGDLNVYDGKNMSKLEKILSERSSMSVKQRKTTLNGGVTPSDSCVISADNGSVDSGEVASLGTGRRHSESIKSNGDKEDGKQSSQKPKKLSLELQMSTSRKSSSKSNIFVDDEVMSPNRRAEQAFFTHVERHSSAGSQKLLDVNPSNSKPLSPSPKTNKRSKSVEKQQSVNGKDTPNPPNAVKNGFCVQSKPKPNQEIKNGSPTSDIKMEKILEEADGQKN